MNEGYIFRTANDSINEIFNPFWLNDTIFSLTNHIEANDTIFNLTNHIEAKVSWYENLDLSTKIALISLGVSVLTFLLGFIVSEAIRCHNKSNELEQYKNFIQEWVEKSDSSLGKYISSLEKFSNEVKINTDLNIVKWRTSMIHLSEINKIPLEKFSDIYIWGHSEKNKDQNRKELMNFLYQIEYLNRVEAIIKSVYDEYCTQNNKILDEWNSNYMQLIDFIGSCKTQSLSPEEKRIYSNITNSIIPLLNKDGNFSGIDRWENEFIQPISTLLVSLSFNSQIINQFTIYVRNMRIVKLKHDKLNQYSFVFNSYINNLKKAQSIIKSSIEHFKSQEIKKYCK